MTFSMTLIYSVLALHCSVRSGIGSIPEHKQNLVLSGGTQCRALPRSQKIRRLDGSQLAS